MRAWDFASGFQLSERERLGDLASAPQRIAGLRERLQRGLGPGRPLSDSERTACAEQAPVLGIEVGIDQARSRAADQPAALLADIRVEPALDGAQVDRVELPLDFLVVHRSCAQCRRSIVGRATGRSLPSLVQLFTFRSSLGRRGFKQSG